MKLHANAALSLNKRRALVQRVVDEGWSLTKAAEAAEVSEPTAAQVGRPLPGRGRGRPARPPLGGPRRPQPHPRGPRSGDLRPAPPADDRRRDRRGPRDGRDHGLGDPHPLGPRPARAPGDGARPPLRALASGRARPHRRQEARRIEGGAGHRVARPPAPLQPDPHRRGRGRRRTRSAGSSSTSASTTPPASPTSRCSPTRGRPPRSASCAGRVALLPPPRGRGRGGDDRQRLRLSLGGARDRLPGARDPSTCAPAPTARRPTARPSASSARCSAAGPTARSTAAPPSAPPRSRAGYGATTSGDKHGALGRRPPAARLAELNNALGSYN